MSLVCHNQASNATATQKRFDAKTHLRRFSGLAKQQPLAHYSKTIEEEFGAMTPKQRRGFSIFAIACLLVIALMLVLAALRDNIVFFYSPSRSTGRRRKSHWLGGLVKEGSVTINGLNSIFTVTDGSAEIEIRYSNALPSLFREGQGVVAEGSSKMVCLSPPMFWQNMMRPTCQRKSRQPEETGRLAGRGLGLPFPAALSASPWFDEPLPLRRASVPGDHRTLRVCSR